MPKFSIVILAYNVGRYIGRCLESLIAQSFSDFEAIVVDDASVDDTREIAEGYAFRDARLRVVSHGENNGPHLVRRSGVSQASGDYIVFLDGDDELTPDFLERLAARLGQDDTDVLHFGMTVVSEGVSEEEHSAFTEYANRPTGATDGRSAFRAIFAESLGQLVDWRITQRVFRTSVLKEAFSAMTDRHLRRAEDAYETFAAFTFVQRTAGAEDCDGYIYHYGRGVTGTSRISSARFGEFCEQFGECIDAAHDFLASHRSDVAEECYEGMCHKLYEILANDLLVRVADDERIDASRHMSRVFGSAVTARELWRFVRDRAYGLLKGGVVPDADDELYGFMRLAKSQPVPEGGSAAATRYADMRRVAQSHLDDLRAVMPIRIYVTAHKRVKLPNSLMLQPVQVGPGNRSNRFIGYLHDDEGNNIAGKNPRYCEMTTQYWAWKNGLADYVGFAHYRRYFNFSGVTYPENGFGEVMDDFIDDKAIEKYGLDDESIRRCVEGFDVITTGFHDLRAFPGKYSTPLEQYKSAERLHPKDIELTADIVRNLYPDYAPDVDAFLNGHESCFCNMYIMRGELFSSYCEWLFPILEAFEAQCDMSHYSKEALRTPGHLAERLFNIYYGHAMRMDAGWKVKQLQCVHFEQPDEPERFHPLSETAARSSDERPVVPVVFASDDAYVPMLTTTIYSMLENASRERFYDVVVLERNISHQKRQQMEEFFARFGNASVRFCNVLGMIQGYDLATHNEHISMETYYRFLVQEILSCYDKVLYLDSDLIVRGDVAKLYDIELGDNLVAAVHDIDYLGNLNMPDGKRMKYTTTTLGLKDPYAYFQAGVLVLNTGQMRRLHSIPEWMAIVSKSNFIYDDQDILNTECQGRVVYLPFDWNVMHDCVGRVAKVFSWAPNDTFDAYNASRANPKVIHYAGFEKPWVNPGCDFATTYWAYARSTPFYEELIARLAASVRGGASGGPLMPRHEKALSVNNPLRRVIDPIAPYGTARREVMKAVGRAVRGRR